MEIVTHHPRSHQLALRDQEHKEGSALFHQKDPSNGGVQAPEVGQEIRLDVGGPLRAEYCDSVPATKYILWLSEQIGWQNDEELLSRQESKKRSSHLSRHCSPGGPRACHLLLQVLSWQRTSAVI